MYKVYFEDDSQMMTLTQVCELVNADATLAHRIHICNTMVVGDFEIINYSNNKR